MTAPTDAGRPPRLRLRARSIAVGALAAVAVVIAAWILQRATRVLGWVVAAAMLAALLTPVVEALARRMRRGLAVAVVVLGLAGLVGALAWAGVGDLRQRARPAALDGTRGGRRSRVQRLVDR